MIKIAHTADLHLDQIAHWFNETTEQKVPYFVNHAFHVLDFIVKDAIDREVDFFIFAGDFFRSHKHYGAVKEMVLSKIISRIKKLGDKGIKVVIIDGNHDSGKDFERNSIAAINEIGYDHVTISSPYSNKIEEFVLESRNGEKVQFFLHPYIRNIPQLFEIRDKYKFDVNFQEMDIKKREDIINNSPLSENEKEEAIKISEIWEIDNKTKRMQSYLEFMYPRIKKSEKVDYSILVAHVNAEGSGYEPSRVNYFSKSQIDKFQKEQGIDYIAGGHIHKRGIIYCGSPIKVSFNEENEKKSYNYVELEKKSEAKLTQIATPDIKWQTVRIEKLEKNDDTLKFLSKVKRELKKDVKIIRIVIQEGYKHYKNISERDLKEFLRKNGIIVFRGVSDPNTAKTEDIVEDIVGIETNESFEIPEKYEHINIDFNMKTLLENEIKYQNLEEEIDKDSLFTKLELIEARIPREEEI